MRTQIDLGEELGEEYDPTTRAACDLVRALDGDERFHRDSALGGIAHPGHISFREITPTGSLHVVIRGDRISAHVDEVSPLVLESDGSVRYAWGQVLAHNVLVMLGDLSRRVRGDHRGQRCELTCQAEWVDDEVELA